MAPSNRPHYGLEVSKKLGAIQPAAELQANEARRQAKPYFFCLFFKPEM